MTSSGINWSELLPRLLEAAVVFLTGLGLFLQNRKTSKKVEETQTKLDDNTKETRETKAAVDNIQVATVNLLDYDRLRRVEAALLTLDECQPCREQILRLTERRRVYPSVAPRAASVHRIIPPDGRDEDIDDPTGTDGGAYPGGRRST